MTVFNKIYLFVFNKYKVKFKQNANYIALYYISILQISLLLLSGVFAAAFLSQMNTVLMSKTKAIVLFFIISVALHFINWMSYSGKSRKEMNAKYAKIKSVNYNLKVLLVIPLLALLFTFILLQSF